MRLIDIILDLRALNHSGAELIAALCAERGVAVSIASNLGQQKLADWLMTAPSQRAELLRHAPEAVVFTVLTGETLPYDPMAVWLAEITDGAVRPEMFHETPAPVAPPMAGADGAADHTPDRPLIPSEVKAIRTRQGVYLSGDGWAQRVTIDDARELFLRIGTALGLAAPAPLGGGVR